MATHTGAAHVVTTTRKYEDQVYRTRLLRRSYREDGKVNNETLGILSHLPDALVDIMRGALRGETFVPLAQAFEISCSRAHGHVEAVNIAMQRLGLASMSTAPVLGRRSLSDRPTAGLLMQNPCARTAPCASPGTSNSIGILASA